MSLMFLAVFESAAQAKSADDWIRSGNKKFENRDYKGAIADYAGH